MGEFKTWQISTSSVSGRNQGFYFSARLSYDLVYDMKIRLEQYKLVYIELQILQVSLEVSFIMLKIEIKKTAKIMCVVLL